MYTFHINTVVHILNWIRKDHLRLIISSVCVTHESSGVKSRGSTTNWGSKLEGSLSESILGL